MADDTDDDPREVPDRPSARRPAHRAAPGAGPGRRTQQASRSDYRGCALWAAGFLVLVIVSFAVGVILRPDSDSTDGSDAVTLSEEVAGDGSYDIVGRIDEFDDVCVTLRRDGEEVTGQCGYTIQDADGDTSFVVTSSTLDDGATVAFGPVPGLAEQVRLTLADGSTEVVDIRRSETLGFSWFMAVVDQDIEGSAELLDAVGDVLPVPSG